MLMKCDLSNAVAPTLLGAQHRICPSLDGMGAHQPRILTIHPVAFTFCLELFGRRGCRPLTAPGKRSNNGPPTGCLKCAHKEVKVRTRNKLKVTVRTQRKPKKETGIWHRKQWGNMRKHPNNSWDTSGANRHSDSGDTLWNQGARKEHKEIIGEQRRANEELRKTLREHPQRTRGTKDTQK